MKEFIEIPASKSSIANRKPICGVGINDCNYITNQKIDGRTIVCPYYATWLSMISRCYNLSYHKRYPTYEDCFVSNEWLTFSIFKEWMESQDWEGKQLDKDIMVIGNKEYSKNTCIFVSCDINNLIVSSEKHKGDYPLGVHWNKRDKRFVAQCRAYGKHNCLGYYKSVEEAEYAYLSFKSKLLMLRSNDGEAMNNKRLRSALIMRSKILNSKAREVYILMSVNK